MGVVKRSVSVDADVWEQLVEQAGAGPVSPLVNDALAHYLLRQRGLAAVAEYEAELGAFSAEELAEADRVLDAAGVLDLSEAAAAPSSPGAEGCASPVERVSGLTYDAGALLAAEASHRRLWALHRRALERSHVPTVPAPVLAQAWRGGPQPLLSRLLSSCHVDALDETGARLTGALLGAASRSDVVDASVVVGALRRGDAVVTSDRGDIAGLADAAGRKLAVIAV